MPDLCTVFVAVSFFVFEYPIHLMFLNGALSEEVKVNRCPYTVESMSCG